MNMKGWLGVRWIIDLLDGTPDRNQSQETWRRETIVAVASLLLVVRPGAPSSVLVPSSDALSS